MHVNYSLPPLSPPLFPVPSLPPSPRYLKNPAAKMGLGTMATAMQDPAGVMETMDMLNDPAFAKEVEELVHAGRG